LQLGFMKIYLAVRYGHPESPDGANGEDTILLIRAESHTEAAEVADDYLVYAREGLKPKRLGISPTCQRLVEIGVDGCRATAPGVIHGSWIRYAQFHHPGCQVWTRESSVKDWIPEEELVAQDVASALKGQVVA